MTETEMKLRDAATQLGLALSNHGDDEVVRSCVNSVISHGRSVTFVMQTESGVNQELRDWYEQQMALLRASTHSPLLRFFNDSRVHSIHRGVVAPEKITAQTADFKVNGVVAPAQPMVHFYRFEGIRAYLPGDSGGVFRLCERYLTVLQTLVSEWLRKRSELGLS